MERWVALLRCDFACCVLRVVVAGGLGSSVGLDREAGLRWLEGDNFFGGLLVVSLRSTTGYRLSPFQGEEGQWPAWLIWLDSQAVAMAASELGNVSTLWKAVLLRGGFYESFRHAHPSSDSLRHCYGMQSVRDRCRANEGLLHADRGNRLASVFHDNG